MSSDRTNWLDTPVEVVEAEEPELVKFTKRPLMAKRTVLVDTNYLNQVNQKDFIRMFFNPHYEDTVSSAQKKQMAKLFREFRNRTIDLIFSDMVIKELIGQNPQNKSLIEVYQEHIIFLSPAGNTDDFLTVSAAINSRLSELGKNGDVKDTYSYLLALAGKIRYFVTEDHDLRPVYDYFSDLQNEGWERKQAEIQKITETLKLLSNGSNLAQSEKLAETLFFQNNPLPMPISLKELKEKLPDVLDRSEVILWIYRSLQDIERLKQYIPNIISEWDDKNVDYCKRRVEEITKALECTPIEKFQESTFSILLVEKASKWNRSDKDEEMAVQLSEQLSMLQEIAYTEEMVPEYASLEDELAAEESEKAFDVKCDNCGEIFELVAFYEGVVEVHEREMGAESCHSWIGDDECPKCGENVSIQVDMWEYPVLVRGEDIIECTGCEVVPKLKPSKPTVSLERFFG